jgi:hypothetical protein
MSYFLIDVAEKLSFIQYFIFFFFYRFIFTSALLFPEHLLSSTQVNIFHVFQTFTFNIYLYAQTIMCFSFWSIFIFILPAIVVGVLMEYADPSKIYHILLLRLLISDEDLYVYAINCWSVGYGKIFY